MYLDQEHECEINNKNPELFIESNNAKTNLDQEY